MDVNPKIKESKYGKVTRLRWKQTKVLRGEFAGGLLLQDAPEFWRNSIPCQPKVGNERFVAGTPLDQNPGIRPASARKL
jgi:hypothetical protein